jgi:hypothetical protein
VLDIGCGDGRVTQAVVGDDTHRIDLVEPSRALLDTALARLATTNATINPHPIGILEHLEHGDASVTWDLAQSTFALHTLHPADRSDTLSRLAARTSHLVIVEFDVPFLDDTGDSASFLQSLADRYDVGVREYPEHPEAVQQFLIPVLLGLLDTDRPRHTYEQPVSQWHADLATAGFRRVITENLFDYWWGTATAITATGPLAARTAGA